MVIANFGKERVFSLWDISCFSSLGFIAEACTSWKEGFKGCGEIAIGNLLVYGEDGSTRDAVLMLDRLMSGIGAPPLSRAAKEVKFEIIFSKDLFDGALLGKHWREFTVQPTIVAVEDIHPLCEEEVSAFWDQLAKCWASIVQDLLLHSEDNFPVSLVTCFSHSNNDFYSV